MIPFGPTFTALGLMVSSPVAFTVTAASLVFLFLSVTRMITVPPPLEVNSPMELLMLPGPDTIEKV